jgi:hypothetical protein
VAECCLAGGLGATLDVSALVADAPERDRILFGESPGRGFVVSGPGEALIRLGETVALVVLGTVGGEGLEIVAGDTRIAVTLDKLRTAHSALAPLFP